MYRCTNIFYQCTTSHDYNPHTHAIVNSVYMIANHVTHGKGLYLLKIFAASQIGEGFSFAVVSALLLPRSGMDNPTLIRYCIFYSLIKPSLILVIILLLLLLLLSVNQSLIYNVSISILIISIFGYIK